MGFDPLDCLTDCIGTIICDYLCCCCCAPDSPGDEVKDGAVDGLIDATTFCVGECELGSGPGRGEAGPVLRPFDAPGMRELSPSCRITSITTLSTTLAAKDTLIRAGAPPTSRGASP